jgi:hypothetical protein
MQSVACFDSSLLTGPGVAMPEQGPNTEPRGRGRTASTTSTELLDLLTPWDSGRVESLCSFLDAQPRLDSVAEQLCYLREASK